MYYIYIFIIYIFIHFIFILSTIYRSTYRSIFLGPVFYITELYYYSYNIHHVWQIHVIRKDVSLNCFIIK